MNILKRLCFQKVLAMAQNQGGVDGFVFYTLNREQVHHFPHVHICVPTEWNGKKYKGAKKLEDGSDLKTVATIKLRPDCSYTKENIEFEKVYCPDLITNKNKKVWIKWLNSIHKGLGVSNSRKCVVDFFDSNPENMFRPYFREILGE